MIDLEKLIGLNEGDAINLIKDAGLKSRMAEKDKQLFILTRDYKTDRVNLYIANNKVYKALLG